MTRNFDFTESQECIRGRFWFPGEENEAFGGILHLEAGKEARLEAFVFNYEGLGNFMRNKPKVKKGERVELTGEAFEKAMRIPSRKIILGHDEHGRPLTLVRCLSGNAWSTFAMITHLFTCEAAIFGVHLIADDLKFDGIRLHLDHLENWVGRSAYIRGSETYDDGDGIPKLSKIVIPIARTNEIPLVLPGYRKSHFYCSWGMKETEARLSLWNRAYLELFYDQPRDWEDIIQEIHQWQWFIGLASRANVEPRQVSVYRADAVQPSGDDPMEEREVWMRHRRVEAALKEERRDDDFHFRFGDIEADMPRVIEAWHRIQKPWAAVLHRFFSVSVRRGLWLNEEFLFLAQAIEALHRARRGLTGGTLDFSKAAKESYLNAPVELQDLIGDRRVFMEQLRKSRNYWTHYGDPGPDADQDVLSGTPLHAFNQKLRLIVEVAILEEIGIPQHCIARVWSHEWKRYVVEYE